MKNLAAAAAVLLALWPAAAAAQSTTVSLTINLVGPSNGSVAVIPGGGTCTRPGSSSCTFSFSAGTRVDLVSSSLSGSSTPPGVFSGGTGSAAGCATSTCTFAID